MKKVIQHYVKTCVVCQRTKTFPAKPSGFLQPNKIPSKPWEDISIDLITGLPESNTFNVIVVIVDRFSKMIKLIATTDHISSEGIARVYRDHVWKDHGIPERIISDRGSVFVSRFMDALHKLIGLKAATSTAYHPQTDGQTERVNQEVEHYLRTYTNNEQDDWSEWLSRAEYAHNNRIHSATGYSPFSLIQDNTHVHYPNLLIVLCRNSQPIHRNEMRDIQGKASDSLTKAAANMKKYYDRTTCTCSRLQGRRQSMVGWI